MHMMLEKEKDQWVMDDNHRKTVKNIHKKILFNHGGENFQAKLTFSLKNACLCTLKVTFITYLLSNSGLLSIKCSNLAILSSKSMSSDYEDKEAMII